MQKDSKIGLGGIRPASDQKKTQLLKPITSYTRFFSRQPAGIKIQSKFTPYQVCYQIRIPKDLRIWPKNEPKQDNRTLIGWSLRFNAVASKGLRKKFEEQGRKSDRFK